MQNRVRLRDALKKAQSAQALWYDFKLNMQASSI